MQNFRERIANLPRNKLALLAAELYEHSQHAECVAEPIAITAMACRFPGGGDTPDRFWSLLHRGADAVQRIPDSRLRLAGMSLDALSESACWGAFLDGIEEFDPAAFGISPKEAVSMDPQQRLLLEVCWEAIENSGASIEGLRDSATGVFIGLSGFDYALLSHRAGAAADGYAVTGVANSVAAGRISYVFGFAGPSMVVDTACSASAAAIHLACQSLRGRECQQALAGGVNLLIAPEITETLSGLQVMAVDGRCKTFSEAADGFVRGEGCGVLMLKRLSDATAQGDRILGVVRGSAWNQDGRSGGLTAPNGAAQERVIRAALAQAGLGPDQISYVEAHGTGTPLGDPIELNALGAVFGAAEREAPLQLGSVKTNIGHLEAAAGVAGVIKVLLAFKHAGIPPHLNATPLSSRVDWEAMPLKVASAAIPWPRRAEPRIAGVSSFGLSGTNVHLVIGEPPEVGSSAEEWPEGDAIVTVSAKSRDALVALAGRYADALDGQDGLAVSRFAASSNLTRAHYSHRLTVVGRDAPAVARALAQFHNGDPASEARSGFAVPHHPPKIGFRCTSAEPDPALAAALYRREPAFRRAWDRWAASCGAPADGPAALSGDDLVVGAQFATIELFKSWGIRAAAAEGAGAGAIAAALAVAAVDLDAAARLLRERGASPPAALSGTADVWVSASPADGAALLNELGGLYRAGAPIDWLAVHRGAPADHPLLPNYPFQRQAYWLEGIGSRRREKGRTEPAALADSLYQVEWRPATLDPAARGSAPETLFDRLRPTLAALAAEDGYQDAPPFQQALSDFAVRRIWAAFKRLRPELAPGDRLPGTGLCAAIGADPRHRRLVDRLATVLEEQGVLGRDGTDWVVRRALPEPEGIAEFERLRREYPRFRPEIDVAERALELDRVLRGEISGVDVLFPDGSFALAQGLYEHSTPARLMNSLVGEVVGSLVKELPGSPRLLEIGGGTGSTTAAIVPHLPPDAAYTFSDVSPAFLTAAQRRFSGTAGFRSLLLDIEDTAAADALADSPCDIVVAANVFHATADLTVTIENARRLLRPGGYLVLLEATEIQPIMDITFGTTDGWWKHSDLKLRPSGPLLNRRTWLELLGGLGFEAGALPIEPDFGGIARQQTIIVARRPAEPCSPKKSPGLVVVHQEVALPEGFEAALRQHAREAHALSTGDAGWLERLRGFATTPDLQVVYLGAASETSSAAGSSLDDLDHLLAVAQTVAEAGCARLWVVTFGAQSVGAEPIRPAAAPLWGFVRSLASEIPALDARLVDLEAGAPSWPKLAELLVTPPADGELALRGGSAHTPRLAPVRSDSVVGEAAVEISREGAYLVTGAFGVLGRLTSRWLAEAGAGALYLVGRREPDAEGRKLVEHARAAGAEVEVIVADIADPAAVGRIFEQIAASPRPLRGIIHSAVALDDRAVTQQSRASLERAFRPKAAGAWLLHRQSLAHELDFFVLYSSGASLIGSPGQSNYAAANSFVDALAHHRRSMGLPAVSLNWGLWERTEAAVKRDSFETWSARGAIPITEESGLAALARLLNPAAAQVAIVPMDWTAMRRSLSDRRPPELLRDLLAGKAADQPAEPEPEPAADRLTGRLRAASAGEQRALIVQFVRRRVSEVLNLDPAILVADDQPLLDLGFDSLVGLDLKNDLQRVLGRPVPANIFFDYPTIGDLSQFLELVLDVPQAASHSAEAALERVEI